MYNEITYDEIESNFNKLRAISNYRDVDKLPENVYIQETRTNINLSNELRKIYPNFPYYTTNNMLFIHEIVDDDTGDIRTINETEYVTLTNPYLVSYNGKLDKNDILYLLVQFLIIHYNDFAIIGDTYSISILDNDITFSYNLDGMYVYLKTNTFLYVENVQAINRENKKYYFLKSLVNFIDMLLVTKMGDNMIADVLEYLEMSGDLRDILKRMVNLNINEVIDENDHNFGSMYKSEFKQFIRKIILKVSRDIPKLNPKSIENVYYAENI